MVKADAKTGEVMEFLLPSVRLTWRYYHGPYAYWWRYEPA